MLDVVGQPAHCANAFHIRVRDDDAELILDFHDDFNGIEAHAVAIISSILCPKCADPRRHLGGRTLHRVRRGGHRTTAAAASRGCGGWRVLKVRVPA